MEKTYEGVDYTQMSDQDVQKDLGILRPDSVYQCDVIADYKFSGDGGTGISVISAGLTKFIKTTIGDEKADIRIKGHFYGSTPIFSASITSSVIDKKDVYDAIKKAQSAEYELVSISLSKDNIYEEDI